MSAILLNALPKIAGAAACCLLGGLCAFAQSDRRGTNPAIPAGASNITVQGVYIDADGVLRHRATVSRIRRAKPLADGSKMIAVSLPKLFAQVKRHVDRSEPLPDSVQWLNGLVHIDHIVVDPDRKELALVGPSEPIDSTSRFRPVGRVTGRPVLHFDDLVVALRTFGPGGRSTLFGCTLVHSQAGLQRVAALPRVTVLQPGQRNQQAVRMKEALGPLEAKYFGVSSDTRFAFVAVEADYRMKQFTIGVQRLPVTRMRNYLARSTGLGGYTRFWFADNYDAIEMTPDGRQYALRGRGLKLLASNSPTEIVATNDVAQDFATEFTKNIEELEDKVPCFADLHNLTDLAVIAMLIERDGLHRRIGLDAAWILAAENYHPQKISAPRQAETLVNSLKRDRKTVTVAGGVHMNVRRIVNRERLNPPKPTRIMLPKFAESEWFTSLQTGAK
ncbi:MAG: DUF1598 domain-containing protein [Planctomycetota bacterium]|nr:DUF1598 domain-containing protein [Planctomycetota bacterium]